MQTIRNLVAAIILTASIMSQGCNESQQTSTGPKTSAKAEKPAALNYDIKDKDAFTLMGTQTTITSADQKDPNTYAKIWDNFEQYRVSLRPLSTGWQLYGVTFATDKKDTFDYVAGMSVQTNAAKPDPNLITRTIPAATYAVFKCTSQDMGKTQQYIYGEWLPKSRYKIDQKACCFEQYSPRDWMNRPIFIFIPVVPK